MVHSDTEAMLENKWNEAEPDCVLELVFVWVTTGWLGKDAVGFISERPELVLVGRQAIARLRPLLDTLPELYRSTSHSLTAMDTVDNEAWWPPTKPKPSRSAKAPLTAGRVQHGVWVEDTRSNQLPACKAAKLNTARRRLFSTARITPVVKFGCCHTSVC